MKNIIIAIAFILVLLASCSSDPIQLENDPRSNLFGTWIVNETIEEFFEDEVVTSTDINYNITFNDNGLGTKSDNLFGEREIEWYYQESPEKVIIVESTLEMFDKYIVLDVHENQLDSQSWSYQYVALNDNTKNFVHTYILSKL